MSAVLNLLILGSVVTAETAANELRPGWTIIVLGSIGFGAILGLIGGIVGARTVRAGGTSAEVTPSRRLWLGRFGIVAAAGTIPVLLSGGLVTSAGAGLAVPDWPTSYNANMFLYPLSKMTGGIYYEHSHRLFGSLAGLTTLSLFIFMLVAEPRKWMKGLGFLAFVAVCGQGVLGGVRVRMADAATPLPTDNKGSLVLAMIHGITGQLFFAFLCAIAAMLGATWIVRRFDNRQPERGLRTLSLILFAAMVIQLSMGSTARHLLQPHALWTHAGFAVVVIALAAMTGFKASGHCKDIPPVSRLGKMLVHGVGLQAVLGLVTLVVVLPYQAGKVDPPSAVILATAHQAVGALLIGTAAGLGVWALRLAATRSPALDQPPSRSPLPPRTGSL